MLLSLALVASCSGPASRGTSIHVNAKDLAEEVTIRRQTYLVEKAIQDVIIAYEMEDLDVDVIIEEEGGLGETRPELNLDLGVHGGRVTINKLLFLEDNPAKAQILLGLFAHELAHALHYSALSRRDLLLLGVRYERFYLNPQGPLAGWARAYEQFTDMTAIAHGFGDALVEQKKRSKENISTRHPAKVWEFYLEPEEIRNLMNDTDALEARIRSALEEIGLASLDQFGEGLIAIRRAQVPIDTQ